jgi:penicillin amidase
VIIALDRERHRAYALRWSGAEPGGASELAALGLNRARSFEEFRAALERWMMPPVEVVYADVSGRIARQLAGAAPMRRGWDGGLPAPGDAPYTWAGQRTAPPVVGPPPDYLASANRNAPRLNRISEVLSERSSSGQTASLLLQRDVRAWRARRLVPLLRGVQSDRDEIESARQRLLAWDERVSADSREGALYVAWERLLVQRLAARRVPEQLALEYASRAEERLVAAIVRRSRVWFPAGAADRNRLLLDALASAVDEQQNGASGRQVTFSHPLALSDAARRRFAVGPFVMPGYAHTVLSVTGSPDRSVGPAFRAVFDAADWDRSVVMNAPGQSEHPGSPHFSDLASLWAKGEVVPLAFSDEAVQANAQATLLLLPPPRR